MNTPFYQCVDVTPESVGDMSSLQLWMEVFLLQNKYLGS